MYNIKFVL